MSNVLKMRVPEGEKKRARSKSKVKCLVDITSPGLQERMKVALFWCRFARSTVGAEWQILASFLPWAEVHLGWEEGEEGETSSRPCKFDCESDVHLFFQLFVRNAGRGILLNSFTLRDTRECDLCTVFPGDPEDWPWEWWGWALSRQEEEEWSGWSSCVKWIPLFWHLPLEKGFM